MAEVGDTVGDALILDVAVASHQLQSKLGEPMSEPRSRPFKSSSPLVFGDGVAQLEELKLHDFLSLYHAGSSGYLGRRSGWCSGVGTRSGENPGGYSGVGGRRGGGSGDFGEGGDVLLLLQEEAIGGFGLKRRVFCRWKSVWKPGDSDRL